MADQFTWFIEAPGHHYLATRVIGRQSEFHWTTDANKALRFASEEQAAGVQHALHELKPELFAFAAVLADARPVEHGFLASVEAA